MSAVECASKVSSAEKAKREQCERANRQASGPVLTSGSLVDLAYSACANLKVTGSCELFLNKE